MDDLLGVAAGDDRASPLNEYMSVDYARITRQQRNNQQKVLDNDDEYE